MRSSFEAFVYHALAGGRAEFNYGPPSEVQSHLVEFNHRVPELVSAHGLEQVGKAIWYLYGCASTTTHDALDIAACSTVSDFYESIRVLYDSGFCAFCDDCAGHADANPNSFSTACYMMWDMDSGLEYLTFRGRPDLFQFGERLVDFGLSHSHAACQESFLHCLGHLHSSRPEFVETKIDRYLQRQDIDGALRDYALACRTGMIL